MSAEAESPGSRAHPQAGWCQLRSQIPAARRLTACHLGGAFGYVDEPPVTGTFTTQHPFPARVELAALA